MGTESAVVAAGVGATLQLLRLTVDLISTASETAKQNDEKIENSKPNHKEEEHEKNNRRSDLSSTRRLSMTQLFNGRLSTRNIWVGSSAKFTNSDDVEEGNDSEKEEPKVGLEAAIPKISILTHMTLFIYFLSATILVSSSSTDSRPEFASALYGGIPLGCVTVGIFFGLIVSLRDYHRKRFGSLQRGLYVSSSLVLSLGCISIVALPPSDGLEAKKDPNLVDIVTLILLVLYAAQALAEGRVCRYPQVVTKEGKKIKLNKRALLTILRPYFWPDATATSATLNRMRAMATWLCVGSSKACSLTAPLLLGTASTALTRYDYSMAIRYAIFYSLAQFGSSMFREAQSLVYLRVAQAAFVQLSEASFNHLHSLSLDWHLRKKLGEVIRSMDRGIAACDNLMKYLFLWLVPAIAECILVTVIFASYFNYFPLAVTIFFFVFAYITWTILVTLWRKKFRKQVAKSDNDWHDRCTDSLINFETVKYFTAEEYEKKRFGDSVENFQSKSVNVQASLSFLNVSQQMMLQACLATSLSLAIISIRDRMRCCVASGCADGNSECCTNIGDVCEGLEMGDFVSVLTYTLNLFAPLNYLGSVYNMIVMALVDLANLSELLAENPDVVDAPDAIETPPKNLDDPDVVVEFDDVKFHYPTQPDTKGLKGLSFKMKRGTVTAIVGPTGEGKTTVSRLLFRFYDVIGGAVKVNGVDVRSLKQSSLRGSIGVVPQNTSLFNDSLKNNIKYGRQDATDEEISSVIDDAQLTSFIDSLPEGWDTMVGDRGLKLSGGEKQRTAIARCLLKNPKIVVLDEATSALDTVTENSVQDALDRLGSDRTCLVIAHRLGTIRKADNIIVLGGGKVAEQGTHDDLLALGGRYADMWNMQLHNARGSTSTATLSELDSEQ